MDVADRNRETTLSLYSVAAWKFRFQWCCEVFTSIGVGSSLMWITTLSPGAAIDEQHDWSILAHGRGGRRRNHRARGWLASAAAPRGQPARLVGREQFQRRGNLDRWPEPDGIVPLRHQAAAEPLLDPPPRRAPAPARGASSKAAEGRPARSPAPIARSWLAVVVEHDSCSGTMGGRSRARALQCTTKPEKSPDDVFPSKIHSRSPRRIGAPDGWCTRRVAWSKAAEAQAAGEDPGGADSHLGTKINLYPFLVLATCLCVVCVLNMKVCVEFLLIWSDVVFDWWVCRDRGCACCVVNDVLAFASGWRCCCCCCIWHRGAKW